MVVILAWVVVMAGLVRAIRAAASRTGMPGARPGVTKSGFKIRAEC
ncbi:hypothetical protein SSBR45G_18130 [Bradyrhizobium sp. SSBR45G]|nr:hypothetical protein [Bradyrhizobium sp. SSBR45R]GLH76905.1 hypothetical protein SSBR45G_18130 [Bradyrhizobium sp. SSBR45G]GLH83663.1 hypothetical protein SSBR45R_11230 [Bradyrhizobium sp. SSBR45R]